MSDPDKKTGELHEATPCSGTTGPTKIAAIAIINLQDWVTDEDGAPVRIKRKYGKHTRDKAIQFIQLK